MLTVNGVTNFTAPVLLQSSLTASSLNLSGGLTVQGDTVLGSSSTNTLVVLAAAAASSTMSVGGLLTASGGLAVSGTSALAGDQAILWFVLRRRGSGLSCVQQGLQPVIMRLCLACQLCKPISSLCLTMQVLSPSHLG